jgi:hypothetical protein
MPDAIIYLLLIMAIAIYQADNSCYRIQGYQFDAKYGQIISRLYRLPYAVEHAKAYAPFKSNAFHHLHLPSYQTQPRTHVAKPPPH